MDKLPRLPWRRTSNDKPDDYKADLPIERVAWARMFLAVSGELRWVWSAQVGAFSEHGRCLGKQECADEATAAVWRLKRRHDIACGLPKDEPFEIDFDGPTETLEDYLFILRCRWDERLMGGVAPPHIADLYGALTRTLNNRKRKP